MVRVGLVHDVTPNSFAHSQRMSMRKYPRPDSLADLVPRLPADGVDLFTVRFVCVDLPYVASVV